MLRQVECKWGKIITRSLFHSKRSNGNINLERLSLHYFDSETCPVSSSDTGLKLAQYDIFLIEIIQ